ncbi:hypothetical protein K2173_027666 [Erythroxylum novogranatense]|uniref:Signal recognition particle 19 kDa protein n=1 Tax=Erythroxylum novogranatense TaxID=1862640 RepID=A0AAV8U2I5_9ROSI|nr:hypothetical protein K2173_027666 [Erythroxylum novogranatense]
MNDTISSRKIGAPSRINEIFCHESVVPFAIELDKAYPRDFMQRGRVRVLLKREDGTLYNPAIHNKKQLMLHVAELIPRHPGRTKKQEATSSLTTVSSKSGKGKKKRLFIPLMNRH